jgi:hypothetical protein
MTEWDDIELLDEWGEEAEEEEIMELTRKKIMGYKMKDMEAFF